jgi:hypothetical protein
MTLVGGSYLLAATSLSGPIRVGAAALVSVGSWGPKVHVGGSPRILVGGFGPGIQISGAYKFSVQSARRGFYPIFLESSSEIYSDFGWDISRFGGLIPEHNPYRPEIPERMIELGDDAYNYMRENQQILRQQHNFYIAGDSTFPWQLVLDTHVQPLYTLGSISRFFSQDFGLIHARYVQFENMIDNGLPAAPVGLIKNDATLTWKVTNNILLSDKRLVVGISGAPITPVNGVYGWAIMDGANLQAVVNESEDSVKGEAFVLDWQDQQLGRWSSPGSSSQYKFVTPDCIGSGLDSTRERFVSRFAG